MIHDEDIGCAKRNGDFGLMNTESDTFFGPRVGWSSCSKLAFLERYNYLEPRKKWCLQPGNTNYVS